MIFFTFGSVIGLSLTSFHSGNAVPVIGMVIALSVWFLWILISSFVGGAYVTGRLTRKLETKLEETEFRDGAHGLVVWAVNLALGSVAAGFLALAGMAGAVALTSSTISNPSAANPVALDYYVDRLLRPSPQSQTAADAAQTPASTEQAIDAVERAEYGRILGQGVLSSTFDETDKAYLAQQISSRTGISADEANQRLDETVATLKSHAESTRKLSVLFGFLTAASFVISGAAAWWAARIGGNHRDEDVNHSKFVRWT
jgi:hypothetical protein